MLKVCRLICIILGLFDYRLLRYFESLVSDLNIYSGGFFPEDDNFFFFRKENSMREFSAIDKMHFDLPKDI